MTQYLSLVTSNSQMRQEVDEEVNRVNQLAPGDQAALAPILARKDKVKDQAMGVITSMLRSKQLVINAWKSKYKRKLTDA